MDKEFIRNLSAAVEAGGRLLGDMSGVKRERIEVEDEQLANDFIDSVQTLDRSVRELTDAVKSLERTIAKTAISKKK